MIPLSAIISSLESGVSVNSEDLPATNSEPGVLKVSCVSDGRFYPQENKRVIPREVHRLACSVRQGDLLVTRANTFDLIGASGLVDRDYKNLYLPDKVWRVVLKDESTDSINWLKHVLNSPQVRTELKKRATGTSGSMKNIPQSSFLAIRVFRPHKEEQRSIADLLDAWDRGIRQLSDLIAAKVRLKQGLMQQLLNGKRRYKEFGDPAESNHRLPVGWQRPKASALFANFSQKQNKNEELLSVTQDRGVIPRSMLEGKVVMPESGTQGYKLVEPGHFVISLRSFQGGLEFSKYRGLVSPAYTVLKPRQTISNTFYRQYFKSFDFIQRLAVAVVGIRDGKQISYTDFEAIPIPQPTVAEQERIAAVLDAADEEIALLQKQVAVLKKQKKGLMQKLLTGQMRVKLPSGEI